MKKQFIAVFIFVFIIFSSTFLLTSSLVEASSGGRYRLCQFNSGKLTPHCSDLWSGNLAIEVDGVYKNCSVSRGVISQCDSVFDGFVVIEINDRYKRCEIFSGRFGYCSHDFNGKYPVQN